MILTGLLTSAGPLVRCSPHTTGRCQLVRHTGDGPSRPRKIVLHNEYAVLYVRSEKYTYRTPCLAEHPSSGHQQYARYDNQNTADHVEDRGTDTAGGGQGCELGVGDC